MDKGSKTSLVGVVAVLAPYVFSFAFAMDIYLPSVPQMMLALHTSQEQVQLTLSIFIFIVGLGQLVMGPVSDQIGRRKIALFSAAVFAVGSLLCGLSPSIAILIIARVIQAIGACGMMVVAMAIVRDLFSGNQAAKAYSFLNCGIAISPLFAPIIGGYLAKWFAWRAAFFFLLLLGVLAFVLVFFKIKETLPAEKRIKLDYHLFKRYLEIVKHPTFRTFAIIAFAALAMFFTFFSSSVFIIINLLNTPVEHFGFYFFLVGLAFFVGSLISGKLVEYVGTFRIVFTGVIILLLSGLLMLYWYLNFGLSLAEFIIPSMLSAIGGAFMIGASAAGAMQLFPHMAGSAAAALGAIQFISAAIVGNVVMLWKVQSTMPYNITLLLLAGVSLVTIIYYKLMILNSKGN